ncbi:MAG: peptide ABC transporter substrate-binding protein [Pseudomonadota bacterium]
MTRFDRRALFASGAAAALLAATGVSAQPARGGRLRAALSPDWFDRAVTATVFDSLTEIAADGTLRGELSTGWRTDQTGRVWTFDLRPGVRFHDSSAFGARDVARLPFDVRITGVHEVEIHLDAPDPNLPYRLAQPGFEIRSETGKGTGLYRVRKLDAGRHFVGERFDAHWKRDAGWFEIVDFVQISAETVRFQALTEGLVDVADGAQPDDAILGDAFVALPNDDAPTHFASQAVTAPMTVGKVWPLDNLRMAERWWTA